MRAGTRAQVDSGLELGWGSAFAAAASAASSVLIVLSPGRVTVGGVGRGGSVWPLTERIRTA